MSLHARAQFVRRVYAPGPGRCWIGARGLSAEPGAEAARASLKPLPPSQQPPRPPPSQPPPPAHSPRVDQRGPLDWRSVAIILGMGTAGLAYYASEKQRRMDGRSEQHHLGLCDPQNPITRAGVPFMRFLLFTLLDRSLTRPFVFLFLLLLVCTFVVGVVCCFFAPICDPIDQTS
jgi:hypothetical protein